MSVAFSRVMRTRRLHWLLFGLTFGRVLSFIIPPEMSVVSLPLTIFISGYSLSYSRIVALTASSELPAVTDVAVHLRRGLSAVVLVIPVALVAFPLLLPCFVLAWILNVTDTFSASVQWMIVITLAAPLFAAVLLPFLGVYIIGDRIAPSLQLRRNASNGWLNRDLLVAPVAFTFIIAVASSLMTWLAFLATSAPIFSSSAPRGIQALGERPLVAAVALIVVQGVGSLLSVVSMHLDGQYACALKARSVPA